jgi:hypothetical protein
MIEKAREHEKDDQGRQRPPGDQVHRGLRRGPPWSRRNVIMSSPLWRRRLHPDPVPDPAEGFLRPSASECLGAHPACRRRDGSRLLCGALPFRAARKLRPLPSPETDSRVSARRFTLVSIPVPTLKPRASSPRPGKPEIGREEVRPYHVTHVYVVPGLLPVAEDQEFLAGQEPLREDRHDTRLAMRILPGPVDVRVAQRHVLHAVDLHGSSSDSTLRSASRRRRGTGELRRGLGGRPPRAHRRPPHRSRCR